MKNAVLSIFVKGKPIRQGKIWFEGKKSFYLQNIDDQKWVGMVGGYAIADQILETFSKAKVRPTIIFDFKGKGYAWSTTATTFNKHGMDFPYGNHRQKALSTKWMKIYKDFKEPHDLPIIVVSDWLKGDPPKITWTQEGFSIQ
jgi:hypothetical protein